MSPSTRLRGQSRGSQRLRPRGTAASQPPRLIPGFSRPHRPALSSKTGQCPRFTETEQGLVTCPSCPPVLHEPRADTFPVVRTEGPRCWQRWEGGLPERSGAWRGGMLLLCILGQAHRPLCTSQPLPRPWGAEPSRRGTRDHGGWLGLTMASDPQLRLC